MQIPSFLYEEQYWQQDISLIAGLDEAGMGALAGPVCAAAVIFRRELQDSSTGRRTEIPTVRDSKTLSAKQREVAATWIREQSLAWAVGEASVEEITELNIRRASQLAMQRAVDALAQTPDLLLLDGTPAQIHPTIPATNIIDGDALCFSIAAASILAKVHRDEIMIELDTKFPDYGFAAHKGYGSQQHLEALHTYGASHHHRPTYAPVAQVKALTKLPKSIS